MTNRDFAPVPRGPAACREAGGDALVIFTRYPEPGLVKKRLIPLLGPAGAARLQREMAVRAVGVANTLRPGVELELHYTGGDCDPIRALFGQGLKIRRQEQGDLGARMLGSFRCTADEGYTRTVLMGTDCPLVTGEILGQAFALLEDHDLVLGPAEDGGYYPVGMKRPWPEIFEGIAWGSGYVLEQTLAKARGCGMRTALVTRLPQWFDQDIRDALKDIRTVAGAFSSPSTGRAVGSGSSPWGRTCAPVSCSCRTATRGSS
jgi:uncharacterized protein